VSADARVRHISRPHYLSVDVRGAANLLGVLTRWLALSTVVPAGVAVGYGESPWPFLGAGAIAGACGVALELATRDHRRIGAREGFLVVSLTWVVAAAIAALPYLLAGEPQLDSVVDAYFEGMSGFTTTGATVLTDNQELSRSLLFWRQLTQWLGGIGIIVLALAVLPRLRVGGRQLFESELPGPEIESLRSRIRDTARRIWLLYLALTVVLAGLLWSYDLTGLDEAMTGFDAVAHALTTIPTGGFSTRFFSLAEFGAVTQWTIVVFMILGGANFALLYRTLVRRRPQVLARDDEFRLYLALLVLGSVVLAVQLVAEGIAGGEEAVRWAVFEAVATMTTTGFSNSDYASWPALALMTIVGLMFVGASAGSTSGSVKVVRHLLLGKILRREVDQTVHADVVLPVRLNRKVVDERTLRAVSAFMLLYIGIFIVGALLLQLDAARVGLDLTVVEAVGASASALGNIGPALGFAGPLGSYEPFSDASTVLMTLLMLLGRLEIIPLVVLASRHYWRAV
jgi:trk system potassium uptake protein TrkH